MLAVNNAPVPPNRRHNDTTKSNKIDYMFIRPLLPLTASFVTHFRQMNTDPYTLSSFIGHSLWVCPTGASRDAYQSIIQNASSSLGTFCFPPHITLVAAMMTSPEDVMERAKILAAKIAPYEFEFESVSQRNAYFQCVYCKMKRTEDVVNANKIAREVFTERKNDPEYMPHLSLVYGDFTEQQKKDTIIPSLETQIQQHAPQTTTIPVDSIEVWSTQGDASEWYLVETVPLTGSKS